METLFRAFLTMSLSGSAAICLVLLARLGLRRAPRIFSYALWSVVLFRLLCPVGIPVFYSQPIPESVEIHAPVLLPSELPVPEHPGKAPLTAVPGPTPASAPDPEALLALVWAAGAAVLLTVGLVSYLRFRCRLRAACRLRGRIYEADYLPSAFVCGLFRPKIYLPSGLSPREQTYIITHERCHLRRLDHLTRPLSYLALCLHWFNPLVWLAFRLSGRDMEMSCDEAVFQRLGSDIRPDYAASLLALARPGYIPGVPLAFGESNTKVRIQNMANWKPARKSRRILCTIITLLVITLCACQPKEAAAENKGTDYPISEELSLRNGSETGCTITRGDTVVGSVFSLELDPQKLETASGELDLDQWYTLLQSGMPDIRPGLFDAMSSSGTDFPWVITYANPEKEYAHYIFPANGRSYSLSLDNSLISDKEERLIRQEIHQLAGLPEETRSEEEIRMDQPVTFDNITDSTAELWYNGHICGGILSLELSEQELQDRETVKAAVTAVNEGLEASPLMDLQEKAVPSYGQYEAVFVNELGVYEHYVFTRDGKCYDLWIDPMEVWPDSKFDALERVFAG